MKFTKPFYGVRSGEIYPEQFQAGDECPAELLDAAIADGAVGEAKEEAAKTSNKAKVK